MPWLVAILVLGLGGAPLGAASPAPAASGPWSVQTTCPPDAEGVQAAVRSYLANPERLQNRGYAPVSPDSLRLLTDAHDAAICATIKQKFTATPRPGVTLHPAFVYLRAGPYYFSALYSVTSTGQRAFGPGHLLVLDREYRVLDSVLM